MVKVKVVIGFGGGVLYRKTIKLPKFPLVGSNIRLIVNNVRFTATVLVENVEENEAFPEYILDPKSVVSPERAFRNFEADSTWVSNKK